MTSPHQYPGFLCGSLERFANLTSRSASFNEAQAGTSRGDLDMAVMDRPAVQQDIRRLQDVVDLVDCASPQHHRDNRTEPAAIHANQRSAGRAVAQ